MGEGCITKPESTAEFGRGMGEGCITKPESTAEFGRGMGEGCIFSASSNLYKIRIKTLNKVPGKKTVILTNRTVP